MHIQLYVYPDNKRLPVQLEVGAFKPIQISGHCSPLNNKWVQPGGCLLCDHPVCTLMSCIDCSVDC